MSTAPSLPQPLTQLPVDPLSDVLSLMRPDACMAGGFGLSGELAISFPKHAGVKCYALLAGDCFLLPHGRPFTLTTDLALKPVDYTVAIAQGAMRKEPPGASNVSSYMAGGFFAFSGKLAEMVLQSLPPIVRLQEEAGKNAIRVSMERMREELANPQPGSSLIAQHLAHTMLIQALRVHLSHAAAGGSVWLFALSDPQISRAIVAMHEAPSTAWTVQTLAERAGMSRSVFASRFQEKTGTTPVEYLTRWRMLLAADRLRTSKDGLSTIAQSLGYESDSAFGKAFRRVMGTSPRQYARA